MAPFPWFLILTLLALTRAFQSVPPINPSCRKTNGHCIIEELSAQERDSPTDTTSSTTIPTIPTITTVPPLAIDDSIFDLIAGQTAVCLFESDIRRDAIGKAAGTQASSATNWIHDATAYSLKQALDKLKLKLTNERTGVDRDEAAAWLRWMKSVPACTLVDLSPAFRAAVNATLTDAALELMDQKRGEFLARTACRLILLPSGAALPSPLLEPTASIIYGKLLYGGVTRCRLLGSHNAQSRSVPRRAGERTEFKPTTDTAVPVWMMFGGPDRMLEAVDMGPAAVLEVILLQRGKSLETSVTTATGGVGSDNSSSNNYSNNYNNMVVNGMMWKPQNMFDFDRSKEEDTATSRVENGKDCQSLNTPGFSPSSLSGKERNEAFRSDFQSTVGGLQPQIESIVRRVLDGRVIRPAQDGAPLDVDGVAATNGSDDTATELSTAALEAEELSLLGLSPVRGLLLYGPPGCGKTALAREISRALKARAPKIVSAPELLDRWVGGSEKLVRGLFADAEAELAACNGDATKSALHVIVIDEIDAVFRKRSSAEDSGEATRSSVVNQILAKLDGVNAIPNVLLIGMTNRRELLDEALLRPGRLEVQIEIPLPTKAGRREILQIHFEALRKRGRLSKPLCCAIDGISTRHDYRGAFVEFTGVAVLGNGADNNVNANSNVVQAKGRKRKAIRQAIRQVVDVFPAAVRSTYDLAADSATGQFSGADIAGLVRCAGSLALARARSDGNGVEGLLITLEDVKQALTEVRSQVL